MGSYLPGDTVFIQAGVAAVDPKDTNLYTLMTQRGKFYANEFEDKMIMDPNDGFTSTEFYNICYYIVHRMNSESRQVAFGYDSLSDIIEAYSMNTILDKYRQYFEDNDTKVGDMVSYIPEKDHENTYTCCVFKVTKDKSGDELLTKYQLYNADNDLYFVAGRSEIQNTGSVADITTLMDQIADIIKGVE